MRGKCYLCGMEYRELSKAEFEDLQGRILYEDNHLLVVAKPPNLPAQADSSGDDDLLSIMKRYIGNKYQKFH